MREVAVDLPKIHLLDEQASELIGFLKGSEYSSFFILCDSNTRSHSYPFIQNAFSGEGIHHELIPVEAGEVNKTMDSAIGICDQLTQFGADRHSLLINLGGGMICDLGGFCASIFKRGIDFIHLPTSLLAMVDASIGGKSGVDHNGLKNQLGVIKQAKGIFIRSEFLQTLEEKEIKSGLAELYKHALIADRELWERMKGLSLIELNDQLILQAANLKEEIVRKDPMEKAERKLLNFGHSIGHALESFFIEKGEPTPHGYAIAAGMVVESYLSEKKLDLGKHDRDEIVNRFKEVYTKLNWKEEDESTLMFFLKHDKKNKGGKLLFSLLNGIGEAVYDQDISEQEVLEALKFYRNEF